MRGDRAIKLSKEVTEKSSNEASNRELHHCTSLHVTRLPGRLGDEETKALIEEPVDLFTCCVMKSRHG